MSYNFGRNNNTSKRISRMLIGLSLISFLPFPAFSSGKEEELNLRDEVTSQSPSLKFYPRDGDSTLEVGSSSPLLCEEDSDSPLRRALSETLLNLEEKWFSLQEKVDFLKKASLSTEFNNLPSSDQERLNLLIPQINSPKTILLSLGEALSSKLAFKWTVEFLDPLQERQIEIKRILESFPSSYDPSLIQFLTEIEKFYDSSWLELRNRARNSSLGKGKGTHGVKRLGEKGRNIPIPQGGGGYSKTTGERGSQDSLK
jgi:hypothetical protein